MGPQAQSREVTHSAWENMGNHGGWCLSPWGESGTSQSMQDLALLQKHQQRQVPCSNLICAYVTHLPGPPSSAAPVAGGWSRAPRLMSRCVVCPGCPPSHVGSRGSACRQCGSPCCWPEGRKERKNEGSEGAQWPSSPPSSSLLAREGLVGRDSQEGGPPCSHLCAP